MAANYVLLETITVGEAGASSVTFNNIPQSGYTDLKVVASTRYNQSAVGEIRLNFNGVTTNLSEKYMLGAGSGSPSSGTQSYGQIGVISGTAATANTFNSTDIYIPNYTSANYKSFSVDDVSENNGTTAYATMWAGLWSSTAAITSATLYLNAGAFVQYSTFSLYGLAAVGTTPVIAPYASGGDIIQTDGTYWYHAFLSSGTFTPAKGLSCDVLVVAGGGGGGSYRAGGGGAGGLLTFTAQTIPANTAQTVTVGGGGVGSYTGTTTSGSNSQFASLTAAIGGGAGSTNGGNHSALTGGSGGGGSYGYPTAAAGTSGQGNSGGNGAAPSTYASGGGGGAGGAASNNSTSNTGGAGGVGATSALINAMASATATGQNVSGTYYYAGGGGGGENNSGGAGGYGGGGYGGYGSSNGPASGTANTGGGGGGGASDGASPTLQTGGKGGSGIVIVRYAI